MIVTDYVYYDDFDVTNTVCLPVTVVVLWHRNKEKIHVHDNRESSDFRSLQRFVWSELFSIPSWVSPCNNRYPLVGTLFDLLWDPVQVLLAWPMSQKLLVIGSEKKTFNNTATYSAT
jgi:hypothetical protein